jgi:hypothetical protein
MMKSSGFLRSRLWMCLLTVTSVTVTSWANPVSEGVPYVTMTTEDMMIQIDGERIHFGGLYTFKTGFYLDQIPENCGDGVLQDDEECDIGYPCTKGTFCDPCDCYRCRCVDAPPWPVKMSFPVPPDATEIAVAVNGTEMSWRKSERTYLTTLPQQEQNIPAEYVIWPTIEWEFTIPEPMVTQVSVVYDHSLYRNGNDRVLLYSLGTSRYVTGWAPPFLDLGFSGKPYLTVTIDVWYDPSKLRYVRHSVWGGGWDPGRSLPVNVDIGRILAYGEEFFPESDFVVVFAPMDLFVRGDINVDGRIDIADPIRLLTVLFLGGDPLDCPQAAECNGDGRTDVSDALYLIGWSFLGGPPPGAPFPACGEEPSGVGLACPSFPPCR